MATSTQHPNNEMDQPSSEEETNNKKSKLGNALKYAYVITVFIFGFGIVGLKVVSPPFDDWLDEMQQDVLEWFLENSVIYIILVILFITIGKGLGVKDVLSLRIIAVVILSYRIVPNSKFLTFVLAVLILGVLSSFAKLLEYRAIGHELQVVQGAPVEFIFKYLRLLLLKCIKDEDKIEWVDPKYTFAISETSRSDSDMDVYTNFHSVMVTCCKQGESTDTNQNQGRHDVDSEAEVTEKLRNLKHVVFNVTVFIVAVVWTSVVEWIQPIAELFQYAHNWELSARNVIIIILSEMVDFDKMVEVVLIIDALYETGDIIAGKIKGILFKPAFWMMGYFIVMPLSLLWAYTYYNKYLTSRNAILSMSGNGNGNGNNEMVPPPLDRTTTPLLQDTDPDVNDNFPDIDSKENKEKETDVWKRMKYTHEIRKSSKTKSKSINFADCRTNTADSTHL